MKRFSVLATALVLLLAACGGTANDTTTTTNPDAANDQSDTSTTEETTTTAATADAGDDGELTLEDFIPGAMKFDENTDWRAMEMQAQQKIAECMAAEGFDYVPFVPAEVGGGFIADEFDEEEYVKTYGFGISTWVLQDNGVGSGEGEDPYADDPNQAIVDAMGDAEREEYYRVLYGGQPPAIENLTEEDMAAMSEDELNELYEEAYADWQPESCQSDAYNDLYGGGEEQQAFWEEFGDDYEALFERMQSDPRVAEADTQWSACMAEKGYDYASEQDMYSYFYGDENGPGEFQQKVDEVITWPDYPSDGEAGVGEEGSSGGVRVATTVAVASDGDSPIPVDGGNYAPQYDMEELQPLIDEEIGTATADFECAQPMRDLLEQLYQEYQQTFIDENYDRLIAFKEANS